jgi:hypothetical protein
MDQSCGDKAGPETTVDRMKATSTADRGRSRFVLARLSRAIAFARHR